MVNLVVIHDDIVDVFEIDFLLEPRNEFTVVGFPHGIDERHFLVADEIGVVAGATMRREFVAMEGGEFPVNLAYPSHFIGYFLSHFQVVLQYYLNASTKLVISPEIKKFSLI